MFREEFHDCYSEKVNLTKLSDRLKLIKAKPLIPIRSMSNNHSIPLPKQRPLKALEIQQEINSIQFYGSESFRSSRRGDASPYRKKNVSITDTERMKTVLFSPHAHSNNDISSMMQTSSLFSSTKKAPTLPPIQFDAKRLRKEREQTQSLVKLLSSTPYQIEKKKQSYLLKHNVFSQINPIMLSPHSEAKSYFLGENSPAKSVFFSSVQHS